MLKIYNGIAIVRYPNMEKFKVQYASGREIEIKNKIQVKFLVDHYKGKPIIEIEPLNSLDALNEFSMEYNRKNFKKI